MRASNVPRKLGARVVRVLQEHLDNDPSQSGLLAADAAHTAHALFMPAVQRLAVAAACGGIRSRHDPIFAGIFRPSNRTQATATATLHATRVRKDCARIADAVS